ncbi:MAG: ribosome biogenesis GTPase Der [Candidatus Anammoxibacter sp.]
MPIPIVIIVGRPNVGKSSLFNCLAGRRISIVDAVSGVTRDRVSVQIDYEKSSFELLDTGGIGINDVDHLDQEISDQIEIAIAKADLILFVVDVHDGITPLDLIVAEKFRKIDKTILLVVNKVDADKHGFAVSEFFKLGMGTPIPISAVEKHGKSALFDKIVSSLPVNEYVENDSDSFMKLAIVGRRNAGKSTLINTLAKEDRVIVSEIPGTTRDSVDVEFTIKDETFMAIDTAGLRKKSSMKDSVEFYSTVRTEKAIRRADVILLLMDATLKISQIEKKLGDYIRALAKPCIIVCNKWDMVGKLKTEAFVKYIDSVMPGISFMPISFISALNKENVIKTIKLAQKLYKQSQIRISTPEFNKFLEHAMSLHKPAARRLKAAKISYGTQVSIQPPTFVLFVNDKRLFDEAYERFLMNQLRDQFEFSEIPLKIFFRSKANARIKNRLVPDMGNKMFVAGDTAQIS